MEARRFGRRAFLATGAAAVGGAAALGGRELLDSDEAASPPADGAGRATVAFHGERQAGVGTSPQAFATLVAFDLLDGVDREALVRLMRVWTDDIERLMRGEPALTDTEPELAMVPARLTITVGFGPGLLTAADREDRAPHWLAPLPDFATDRLREEFTGGDLVVQVCADDDVTVSHAVRVLTKQARTFVRPRWVQKGFRNSPGTVPPGTTMRNLMGQVDGSRNLRPGTADDRLIWAGAQDLEWLRGGTGMVVRRIAMELDTWDELDRSAREQTIGRRLADGAPLTGRTERDEPDLEATTDGGLTVIPPFAHIRRARSDDPGQRFLRRAYNYDDPPAAGELSNSGLVFVTFQADIGAQFTPIQRRIDELDLLNDWTTPIGSAVFAVPRGCRPGEYLGQALLED